MFYIIGRFLRKKGGGERKERGGGIVRSRSIVYICIECSVGY